MFFKKICHGFILLKLVEITGNDNGMVVFSGDVHLRFERYFRCNDQLMSCPFPVPICERLAFNVFPCHTSLFLEPCEWQESHHISSHGFSIIAKGQGYTPGSVRRFRITSKSGKRRLAVQMSKWADLDLNLKDLKASLTCSWFGMGNFHEEALLWQLVTHAIQPLCTKIGWTLPVPVLYVFILHTSCSSIWMQADLPAFPCYPGSWKFLWSVSCFQGLGS